VGALLLADVGQGADALELLGAVDRADVGVLVERVAEAQRGEPALEPLVDVGGDRLGHEQAAAGAAHVALVEEDAVHDALDRLVERGVVEHDVGRLAPELEGELLARAGDRAGDLAADLGRPRERHLVDARVLDEGPAGVAGAGDDVDDAGRQVGLPADLGERQRGERRGLGRLEDDRVAAGQGRRDLPREHEQREVPGDHLAGHAHRPRVRPVAGVAELVGPARVVEEVRRDQGEVDVAALADRLAVVDRLEHRELAGPLLDEPGDAVQVLAPLAARQLGPHVGVRPAGGGDRPVDVARPGRHDLGQHLFGGRVHRLERRAVDRVHHVAVDEQPVRRGDVDDRAGLGGGRVLEGHGVVRQSIVNSSGSA
jgi:hypothetical protein